MILLYCFDIAQRRKLHGYFRDKGISLEATPPGEFRLRSYATNTKAILVAGTLPPCFTADLDPQVTIITIGKHSAGGSVNFHSFEDPALLDLLRLYSEPDSGFDYNGVLSASAASVSFMGYDTRLTATERSVLSFLVQESERDVAAYEIAEVCVGNTHLSEASVSKHVSLINGKAREIGGRSLIFSPAPHFYRIKKYV